MLLLAHHSGDGVANLFEPGEIPEIRKIPALLGFDRLNDAILPLEKDAFPIGFIRQGQALPIGKQSHVPLDEFLLG